MLRGMAWNTAKLPTTGPLLRITCKKTTTVWCDSGTESETFYFQSANPNYWTNETVGLKLESGKCRCFNPPVPFIRLLLSIKKCKKKILIDIGRFHSLSMKFPVFWVSFQIICFRHLVMEKLEFVWWVKLAFCLFRLYI